jgi:hypothetical protein
MPFLACEKRGVTVVVCSFVSFALVFVMNSSGGWK